MIITAVDYNNVYFDQLLVLLVSIKTNSPGDKVSIFLVDFPKHVPTKLRDVFNGFEFINKKSDLGNAKSMAGFMTCYRTLIFKEYLEKYKKPIAWLDVDIIVRKNLVSLWNGIETSQFKVLYRKDRGIDVKFNTGVLVVGYSDPTCRMVDVWNDYVQAGQDWYVNQRNLYKAYLEHKDEVVLIPMPREIHDIGDSTREDTFNDDSVLWHCKKSHFNHPRFQKEYLKYLKIAKEMFNE